MNKPTKEQIESWYLAERKSTRQIADACSVSHMTVKRWLRMYDIPRRSTGRGLANRGVEPPSREDLYRMVHLEHLGYREIADQFGVDFTAVPFWLRKHDIPRPSVWETRNKGPLPPLPLPDIVRALYAEGLSLKMIAARCGVTQIRLTRLCREHNIERRPGGFDGGKRYLCHDGHLVRSLYEQQVDNWLFRMGVAHEYEPVLPCDHRYHSDFLANGHYIEIWGVTNSLTYAERKDRKRKLYRSCGLPLIELGVDMFSRRRAGSWERRLKILLTPASVPPVQPQLFQTEV